MDRKPVSEMSADEISREMLTLERESLALDKESVLLDEKIRRIRKTTLVVEFALLLALGLVAGLLLR